MGQNQYDLHGRVAVITGGAGGLVHDQLALS
jgi:hypothetical protein